MTINLSSYRAVESALFVRIDVPGYAVLRFSDYKTTQTINGESYAALGQLVGITDSTSSIKATQGNMSITISGIPDSSIAEVLAQKFKGSAVQVWRVFYDAETGTQLAIAGNPAGRFQGIIDNWSLEEDYTPGTTDVSNKILFTCSSSVDVLVNKIGGRRTNSNDQKALYPSDLCFDRVTVLMNSSFDFGVPK
jgi:hypothetical protein